MAVRIGKIDLVGLQNLRTEDNRNLVQQRGPGQQGSVFQDLGREPVTIILEGLLLGDDTQSALSDLRQAQQQARPLSFSADVVAGSELTDVLILDLKVHQLAGYANRFWFYLKVREHKEPPEPAGVGLAAVNADIASAADDWGQGAAAAALGKLDPSSMMSLIQNTPSVLQHLSGGDIGGMLKSLGVDSSNLGALGDAIKSVGKLDPELLQDGLSVMQGKKSLGELVQKLSGGGSDLLSKLSGVNLGAAKDLVEAVAGGADFIGKLKKVLDQAAQVGGALQKYKPADVFKPLVDSVGGR